MSTYPIDIKIDTASANRSTSALEKSLDDLSSAAADAARAANNLSTCEQQASKSAQQLAQQQTKAGNAASKSTSQFNGLATAAKGLGAIFAAQQILEWGTAFVTVADNINLLQSRINLYTKSQQETNQVFGQLQAISNRAGVSLQETAQTFTQFAAAGKDMGVSNQQVLQLVQNLQTMARVSGASGEGASAAIYQLSQAFASGRLQGDEFRSVAEQMPVILDILSKKLGVTRGELRQMATDGKLNSDVLLMLSGDFSELDAQAAKLPRTVAQASDALMNNLGVAADALNDKLGLSQGVAKSIDGVSQALDYWTKHLNGTTTEVDELGRQLLTQNGILQRQQAVYDDLSDKTGMYGKYLQDQINKQKAAVAETENQINSMQRLASMAQQLAGDMRAITAPAKQPRADSDAQKQIDSLKGQLKYTKALADGNYELAAAQKLGNKATKDQISSYAVLLKQQAEYKQGLKDDKKAQSEASAAAKRSQKELERNQAANEKYLKTLNDKVNAGQYDVQLAREQVQLSLTQGASVDQLTAAYQKSYQVQQQLTLQSQQAEAQSRLNKDATDAEHKAVDEQVAALQRQQEAKRLAAQVSQVQSDVTSTLNPVQGQLDQINEQEAQRLTAVQAWRQQFRDDDLAAEQQYQDLKTQIMMAGEQQRNDVMTANNAMLLGATGDLFGGLADVLKNAQGEQSSIYKTMFAASKAFAIAQASVLLWQNVSKAMAIGFPQNIPFIAGALAQGTSILTSLSSVAATGFATGGLVTGPGTGQSDSINARLSNGEYVMTRQATSRYRDTLDSMNRGTATAGLTGSTPEMKVNIANYGGEQVRVQKGLTADEVRIIIGEEVPKVNSREFSNPYSKTNKAFRGSYDANRKV
ncbi:TPA: tape measure protein [Klebsiella pneumoniae]|uniref:tape measure protein n=1 Tax=Klebsiella pneumoniae TaxID=573 RepID=UPI0023B1950C|nr:tape measure protein [Klebsiella pneumoniae]HDU6135937.1 tape measure protein [Klebsiella pneumoniae subsp. pneumoniae]MDE8523925.1 tape measure protein [Klebsiella pneumoniae]HBQ1118877.1 tape measure protein [Klebsiella pneumoniae]HBQ1562913.1 tape measure protein [Klebsiella pneumoniae]HBU6340944.1 tape measure protein [Klebsiella pneumoniae]